MNIKVGSSIKNKKDAKKFLKEVGFKTETDGWKEMKERHEKIDKEYKKVMCAGIKDRIPGRRVCFNYREGQFEQIFGGGEGREKRNDE